MVFPLIVPPMANAQCQVDQTFASDAKSGDRYGFTVAIAGDLAIVGATVGDATLVNTNSGTAYILRRAGLDWEEMGRIHPTLSANDAKPGDEFGYSVAMTPGANLVVVGAPNATGALSTNFAGAAYVFRGTGDSWVQERKLVHVAPEAGDPNPLANDEFGVSLAIDGDWVAVGAPGTDELRDGFDGESGSVYLYRRYVDTYPCVNSQDCQVVGLSNCLGSGCQGLTWIQEQKLTASNAAILDGFGTSVALRNEWLFVGAPGILVSASTGQVYVFRREAGTWVEKQILRAPDDTPVDIAKFGASLATDGLTLVVGSIDKDGTVQNAGAAYVYRLSGDTWTYQAKLTASNALRDDRLGRSVAVQGNRILVGTRETDRPGSRAGSAYLFEFDGTGWVERLELAAGDAATNAQYGHAVALTDKFAVVGAYLADTPLIDAGSAYFWRVGLGEDCNENGEPDECDVLDGTLVDEDGNGVPDECECTSDAECNDSLFCNGPERCLDGECQPGDSPCDPLGMICNEERDECGCFNDTSCDDGLFCTGVETCIERFCVSTGSPCMGSTPVCDEESDLCVECLVDADCNDEDFCTGVETCQDRLCAAGTRPDCDDGLYCTGVESCLAGACQSSGNPCSGITPRCDEQSDTCGECLNNEDCDDGDFCTGTETCRDRLCVAGTPPDCDDGRYCTGLESCEAGACVSSGDPCEAEGLFCHEIDGSCRASAPGKLIYQNTGGTWPFRPRPAGIRVADDITTTATAPCEVSAIRVRVNGGVPGGGGMFTARFQLWDRCPGTSGATRIEGADWVFAELSDNAAIDHDLWLGFPGAPRPLPPSFWISVFLNTSASGVYVGTPATVGFSADLYHHPFLGCAAWFGGWPTFIHTSFFLEVYASEDCPTHWLGYHAAAEAPSTYVPPNGSAVRVADDLELIVEDCDLHAYELAMRGTAGLYTMSIDLRRDEAGSPGSVIDGTAAVYQGKGQGSFEVAHFTFEDGIQLPRQLWMTWLASRSATGALATGESQIGFGDPASFALSTAALPGWTAVLEPNRVFYASIFCRGTEPTGACCRTGVPDGGPACVDNISASDCAIYEPGCGVFSDCAATRWVAGAVCGNTETDPFDPPCRPCTAIVASDPPPCAVDARPPFDTVSGPRTGWGPVGLTFGPPGCEASLLDDRRFTLSDSAGRAIAAPRTLDWSANSAVLTLAAPATGGDWVCISHADTAGGVCLATLPGDVNSDRTVSPALDLTALIDCLNRPGTCPSWRADIYRTGGSGSVLGVSRLVDLFNGADGFPSYSGAAIGPCPGE